ncbi:MAG: carbonic anhydrase family protein [Acidobacteriota bacterium]|nr:carbonic anhydrase family protein [Acidobacteriota bacterium]
MGAGGLRGDRRGARSRPEGDRAAGVGECSAPRRLHTRLAWDAIPSAGEPLEALAAFDPRALLPEGGSHYCYPGSLTTPGCSEIVSWVVMTDSVAVSQDQVDAFAAIYPMNARPVQPVNERTIELRQ